VPLNLKPKPKPLRRERAEERQAKNRQKGQKPSKSITIKPPSLLDYHSAIRMTKANAALRIDFRSKRQMHAIAEALRPEATHPAGRKARALITERGKQLVLRFEAQDSAILRAIMSSYLRMITACLNASNALLELERLAPRKRSDKN